MTAPLREVFINNGNTTISSSANTTVTSLSVASGGVFPSTGNFRVKVDDEIMLCTARSSNTLTVSRAAEGTSAASHTSGATISSVLTEGAIQRWGRDNHLLWNNTGLPDNKLVQDDGITPLLAADFTAINAGHTTTFADNNGGILLSQDAAAAAATWHLWSIAAPGSTPYEYTAKFSIQHFFTSASDMYVGFGFRESGTSKISVAAMYSPGGAVFRLGAFDNTTQSGTNVVSVGNTIWMRVKYDGTNVTYKYSYDGINFGQTRSVAVTTPFTTAPDQVVWGILYNNGVSADPDAIVHLTHWSRTA